MFGLASIRPTSVVRSPSGSVKVGCYGFLGSSSYSVRSRRRAVLGTPVLLTTKSM
jgi:hypothetical protein